MIVFITTLVVGVPLEDVAVGVKTLIEEFLIIIRQEIFQIEKPWQKVPTQDHLHNHRHGTEH